MIASQHMREEQIKAIKEIFTRCKRENIPLWLDGGWAIDAQLGKVTREHGDIDVVFPEDRRGDYYHIVRDLGFMITEEMDYGFLATRGDILLDSEVCKKVGDHYEIEDQPENACTAGNVGQLDGVQVDCVSWDKMFYEFLFLDQEVKREDWEPKHFASLRIIESHLSPEARQRLKELFEERNT